MEYLYSSVIPSIEGDVKTNLSCTPDFLASGVPTPTCLGPFTEAPGGWAKACCSGTTLPSQPLGCSPSAAIRKLENDNHPSIWASWGHCFTRLFEGA